MDDKSRRRIRSFAKPIFWLIQVCYLAVLAYALFMSTILPGEIAETTAQEGILKADRLFTNVFFSNIMLKAEAVASHYPPENPQDLESWSEGIAKELDVPCAVFYYDGKQFYWPLVTDKFEAQVDSAEVLALAEIAPEDSQRISMLGSVERFARDFNGASLNRYRLANSDIYWGYFLDYKDEYPALIKRLEAAKDNPVMDWDVRILDGVFRINLSPKEYDSDARQLEEYGNVLTRKYGLRIYSSENDSLLYSTPGINLSNEKYTYKPPSEINPLPYWHEIYNHEYDQGFRHLLKNAMADEGTPWGTIIIIFLGMIVTMIFYNWILRLTKPMQAEVP